jgi:hypothetical protein
MNTSTSTVLRIAMGVAALALAACGSDDVESLNAARVEEGQQIFRNDTFGDEQLWTDQLRMHEVIASAVSPKTALAAGLKVDAAAVPPDALATVDLNSPAATVELLRLDAVVGVNGRVENGRLMSVGVTCALCHSTVDNSVAPGIGQRLDGWANRDLDPGLILRATTKQYRTTPRRGVWQHPPYFHDGSARTLADVVRHYDTFFRLG